jgi:IclR family transcriptional regulator, KDG regulon repressor
MPMDRSSRPLPRIQSLARMDAILESIARAPETGARLTDIAAATKLHKNTAFSLLKTLVSLGYCDHLRDSQTYRIGRRTFELARNAERNLDIVSMVRPLMLRLVWQFRESLSLAVPANDSCLVVSTVEGTYGVRGSRFQGQFAPYHASSLGKAILAFQTDEDRGAIIERLRLERYTSRTIVSATELEAEATRVRRRRRGRGQCRRRPGLQPWRAGSGGSGNLGAFGATNAPEAGGLWPATGGGVPEPARPASLRPGTGRQGQSDIVG